MTEDSNNNNNNNNNEGQSINPQTGFVVMSPPDQRHAVITWANIMAARMEYGLDRKRPGWLDKITIEELDKKLRAKMIAFFDSLDVGVTYEAAADVANYLFMLVEHIRGDLGRALHRTHIDDESKAILLDGTCPRVHNFDGQHAEAFDG